MGRVSLTFDIWSAASLCPFMAVTAHWIKRHPTGSMTLESDLLAFHYLPGNHTGERIALALIEVIDFFDISDKVGLQNTNITAMHMFNYPFFFW